MDLKIYLALTGAVGLAYVSYTYLNKPKQLTIPKDLTKRICQQIKHQMMIVCITYSKAMKKIRTENADKIKGNEAVFAQFRNQLSQVYVSKEQLILKKYVITRQAYGKSLEKYKGDKQIVKNTTEILEMMERAVNGQAPDFTINPQAHQTFNRDDLCNIYRQMVTLIGKKVTHKLIQKINSDSTFNSNSDDDFRNAIRELSIYDLKVDFLKSKGFKQEWGCPNEVFFKYLESQKTKDQQYEKKIVLYEKCYEKIIEIVSADPKSITDRKIDEMFENALTQPVSQPQSTLVARPVQKVQAPKLAPVVQPQPIKQAVRPAFTAKQQADEDAELEALMMQQLMNRSQDSQVEVPSKLGLTSSEIQQDWEKHGSIHEHQTTKMQEATEEILIGREDKQLIRSEQKVLEQAIKQAEQELQDEVKVESTQPIVPEVQLNSIPEENIEVAIENQQVAAENNVENTEVVAEPVVQNQPQAENVAEQVVGQLQAQVEQAIDQFQEDIENDA